MFKKISEGSRRSKNGFQKVQEGSRIKGTRPRRF